MTNKANHSKRFYLSLAIATLIAHFCIALVSAPSELRAAQSMSDGGFEPRSAAENQYAATKSECKKFIRAARKAERKKPVTAHVVVSDPGNPSNDKNLVGSGCIYSINSSPSIIFHGTSQSQAVERAEARGCSEVGGGSGG